MSLSRSLLLVAAGLAPALPLAGWRAGAAVAPALTDARGAPLPPFARARLGTLGWRNTNTITTLSLSPDGKWLVSGDRNGNVRLWEVPGGRELRRWQFASIVYSAQFAAGGKNLIVGVGGQGVRWLDARTGKVRAHRKDHYLGQEMVAVSADGKTVATCTGGAGPVLHFWDGATGAARGRWRLPSLASLALSPDGKLLATAEGASPTVRLWDVATGKLARQMATLGIPALAEWAPTDRWLSFSGDGKWLGAVTGGQVAVWHTATGKSLLARDRLPKARFFLFAPDSASVTLVQNNGADRWQLSAPSTAPRPLFRSEEITNANRSLLPPVAFSRDGKWLVTASEREAIQFWDTRTGARAFVRAGHTGGGITVRYVGNGDRLLSWSRQDESSRFWDVARARQLEHFPDRRLLSVSADGKPALMRSGHDAVLVAGGTKGKPAGPNLEGLVWTGRSTQQAVVAPDGQALVTLGDGGIARCVLRPIDLRLYDRATGKKRWELSLGEGPLYPDGRSLRFSPDGKLLATTTRGYVALVDTRTGALLPNLPGPAVSGRDFVFSPDGSLMIVVGGEEIVGARSPSEPVTVWDLSLGKRLLTSAGPPAPVTALALSRNGRYLFAGGGKGAIVVWDLFTKREKARLAGHADEVCSLDVSPDGHELASGSEDTTILLWRLTGLLARRPRPIHASQMRTWWGQLASADGLSAYRAAWSLAEADQAVPFLATQLRPIRPLDDRRRARLLADLDSDDFETREQAEKELGAMQEVAAPALRAALRNKPSLDLALRARRLLERISPSLPRQQALALMVLEDVGSPAARRLLRELAGGAAEARLTKQARAALERLGRRPMSGQAGAP
jgi:WD40 repeat protein